MPAGASAPLDPVARLEHDRARPALDPLLRPDAAGRDRGRRRITGVRWTRRGGDWDLIFRVAVWGVASGIVGARLYHVITSWNELPDEWWGPFAVWKGGLGVWGGIGLGCVVGRDRREALRRDASPSSPTASRRGSSSRRASAASATGGTRSSSASRPTCRGGSRSTPRTGRSTTSNRRPSIRRSSTRRSGASPRLECSCSIERRFNASGRAACSRSTCSSTRRPLLIETLRIDPSHEIAGVASERLGRGAAILALGRVLRLVAAQLEARPARHRPRRSRPWRSQRSAEPGASGRAASLPRVLPMPVRELELELDAFEGPFDLLLTLLLKEELEPREIDVAAIVLAFVERLAERGRARSRGVRRVPRARRGAARAEGARALPRRGGRARRARARGGRRGARATPRRVPPHEGGRGLARRAARRRAGPLLPARARAARATRRAAARAAGSATRSAPRCARSPCRRRPSRSGTWRSASRRSRSSSSASGRCSPGGALFDFDAEVEGLSRVEQAVALLALLELRKAGEIALEPGAAVRADKGFASRRRKDRRMESPLRLIAANPVDRLARTVEALLVVASAPLSRRRALRGDGGSSRAHRDRARPPSRALQRGAQRHRARAGRRRLRVPREPRGGRRVLRGCSSGRSSAGSRRRRSRRSRSSPTSGRARGPTSRESAASPPTRPSRASSSAA